MLIKRDNFPLVVIEVKYGDPITHDIIVYSNKSLKHKQIYPYLRYGMLIGNSKFIPNRFFTHNTGFDFCIAFDTIDEANINDLVDLLIKQIESAEELFKIQDQKTNKEKTMIFNSIIETKKYN